MSRLIDADALIAEIEGLSVHITGLRAGKGILANFMNEYRKSVLRIIDEQPTVYNGWIPCSERLPNKEEYLKNDGRFIVTDGNRVYQSIYDIYICHCFRTSYSFPFGSSYKTSYEIDNCVIAWQPLPEPYKPKERPDSTTEAWKQQTMKRFERVE